MDQFRNHRFIKQTQFLSVTMMARIHAIALPLDSNWCQSNRGNFTTGTSSWTLATNQNIRRAWNTDNNSNNNNNSILTLTHTYKKKKEKKKKKKKKKKKEIKWNTDEWM